MKIQIKKDFTITELKQKIDAAFPQYTTSVRQGRILVVKKSGSAAALIFGGTRGSAQVKESFPTMGQYMLYTLLFNPIGYYYSFDRLLHCILPRTKCYSQRNGRILKERIRVKLITTNLEYIHDPVKAGLCACQRITGIQVHDFMNCVNDWNFLTHYAWI